MHRYLRVSASKYEEMLEGKQNLLMEMKDHLQSCDTCLEQGIGECNDAKGICNRLRIARSQLRAVGYTPGELSIPVE